MCHCKKDRRPPQQQAVISFATADVAHLLRQVFAPRIRPQLGRHGLRAFRRRVRRVQLLLAQGTSCTLLHSAVWRRRAPKTSNVTPSLKGSRSCEHRAFSCSAACIRTAVCIMSCARSCQGHVLCDTVPPCHDSHARTHHTGGIVPRQRHLMMQSQLCLNSHRG